MGYQFVTERFVIKIVLCLYVLATRLVSYAADELEDESSESEEEVSPEASVDHGRGVVEVNS